MNWRDVFKRKKRKAKAAVTMKGVSDSVWSILPEQLTAKAIRKAIKGAKKTDKAEVSDEQESQKGDREAR